MSILSLLNEMARVNLPDGRSFSSANVAVVELTNQGLGKGEIAVLLGTTVATVSSIQSVARRNGVLPPLGNREYADPNTRTPANTPRATRQLGNTDNIYSNIRSIDPEYTSEIFSSDQRAFKRYTIKLMNDLKSKYSGLINDYKTLLENNYGKNRVIPFVEDNNYIQDIVIDLPDEPRTRIFKVNFRDWTDSIYQSDGAVSEYIKAISGLNIGMQYFFISPVRIDASNFLFHSNISVRRSSNIYTTPRFNCNMVIYNNRVRTIKLILDTIIIYTAGIPGRRRPDISTKAVEIEFTVPTDELFNETYKLVKQFVQYMNTIKSQYVKHLLNLNSRYKSVNLIRRSIKQEYIDKNNENLIDNYRVALNNTDRNTYYYSNIEYSQDVHDAKQAIITYNLHIPQIAHTIEYDENDFNENSAVIDIKKFLFKKHIAPTTHIDIITSAIANSMHKLQHLRCAFIFDHFRNLINDIKQIDGHTYAIKLFVSHAYERTHAHE